MNMKALGGACIAIAMAVGLMVTPTASAHPLDRPAPNATSQQVVPRWGPSVQVPARLKRNFERAVKRCGYFLQECPYGTWGERSLYDAGRDIMCSPSRSAFKYSYPSLSVRTPQMSWATMLVQFKLAWSQRTSGQRVTVAVDGRFGPVTAAAWRKEAQYAPVTPDDDVTGESDWVWVFMFYCGD
jgi:hypothetical protein